MTHPPLTTGWATVPRLEQIAEIRDALDSGHSAVVIGPAGVGKTHLVGAVLRELSLSGSNAVLALSGADIPTRPLAELVARSGHPSPVVRVEDGHELLPDTARELTALARSGAARVLVTLRPAAAGRAPWLALWKDEVAARIDVSPFTDLEVDQLLHDSLGGPTTPNTFIRIMSRTGGNAFFLRETLRAELAAGSLAVRQGVWMGTKDAPLTPRVRDYVRGELAQLSLGEREALELVALAGELPVRQLTSLVPDGVLGNLITDEVISVEASGPLESALIPTARAPHPMVAEAVRTLMPPDRGRRLHDLLHTAEGARSSGEPPAMVLHTVTWALEHGLELPPGRVMVALREATRLNRWTTVERIATAALSGGLAQPEVLLRRAYAWRVLSEPARAVADLSVAQDLLRDHSVDPMLVARLAEMRADLHQYHENDLVSAVNCLDEARARLVTAEITGDLDPLATTRARHFLEVARVSRLGQGGRFDVSISPALTMLEEPDPHATHVLLRLVHSTALGLGQMGRISEARALCERYEPLVPPGVETTPLWVGDDIVMARFHVHRWEGDVRAMEDIFTHALGTRSRFGLREAYTQIGVGMLAAARGHWSEARTHLVMASARYSVDDLHGVGAYATSMEALALAATGDARGAREAIDRTRTIPLRVSAALESDLRLNLVDVECWLGSDRAWSEAAALARWCRQRGLLRTELEAWHRTLVAARPKSADSSDVEVLARIRELGEQVSGPRPQALVAHATAVVEGDGALAQIAERELGACGLWLPPRRTGASLTRREREIAALAAGGLSSRAIAERFTLSVRTIDSHLSRVYTKLGVNSRRELADTL